MAIKILKGIGRNFFTPKFSSEHEQDYCYSSFVVQREKIQKLVILVSMPLHILASLFSPLFIPSEGAQYVQAIHFSIASVQILTFWIKKIPYHAVVTLSWLMMISGYSYFNFLVIKGVVPSVYHAPLTAYLLGLHSMYIILAPFYRRFDYVFPLLSMVCILVSLLESSSAWLYINAYFCIDIWAIGYRRYAMIYQLDNFREEYRHRSQVLPAKFLLNSITAENLRDVFPAENRLGIFISSDWRNYQRLTSQLEDGRISEILGQYYELCDGLLDKHFPDRGYFLDWIADELFVVIFCSDKLELKKRLNQSLKFSSELLLAKDVFFLKWDHKQGIDVGITHGESQIGMMGPGSHLKATALGQIPGRARRLQSFGKDLRVLKGDQDRIVMDSDTFLLVSQPFEIKEFELRRKIEDLQDNKIFYIEHSLPEI